ncbi:MAG: valine--tRNA ligase [Patescibacteria group bacterium]
MQKIDLPRAYDPKAYEDAIYTEWENSGFFNPDNLAATGEPFAILMPPPNVTGVLHLGHALENTLMDSKARFERMLGKKVVIIPGTDHAALPTQARVENNLREAGMKNPRQELGREELLRQIREYADQSRSTILSQIRKMGTSCDWSRLAYTFDEPRSKIVNDVFVRMFNDGLIYRGYRVVNWSVLGQSTASDDEVEYVEQEATLYTFRYSANFPIPIATVLPETKLGDTAVAVHPDDARYNKYIGQTFTVDVGAEKSLKIHVLGDKSVDSAYGTGALGVTPAHSATDFEMYQQHPEIGLIPVIGADGKMTEQAGKSYAGLPVKQAREKFVTWLKDQGLLIKEEKITHNVAVSDRFKDEIWPIPMEQWFIDVNKQVPGKGRSLRVLMREAVTTGLGGDKPKKISVAPDRFTKSYLHWIDHLHDWCISRQIWWGHRIPVWTRGEEVYSGTTAPEGEGWKQDDDTLDTWFSSGMWTFSTLGWPDNADFKTFHPTAWMQMGYEIIYLWMARMILFSAYLLDDISFKQVYIHGILRDKDGRKFSKSMKNGIDPLEVIAEYGTDALRLSVIKGIAPGNDARFSYEKIKDSRNFINKLWNVSRYILSMEDKEVPTEPSFADRWILSRLQTVTKNVTKDFENDQFSRVAEQLYDFVWHELADWYLEAAKVAINPKVLRTVLETVLKLMHPVAPFVTEAIWKSMGHAGKDLLLVAEWPKADTKLIDAAAEEKFQKMQELIVHIRNIRAEYQVAAGNWVDVWAETDLGPEVTPVVEKLARVKLHTGMAAEENSIDALAGGVRLMIPLAGLMDVQREAERLSIQQAELIQQIESIKRRLSTEDYVKKAPPALIERDRSQLASKEEELKVVQEKITHVEKLSF